MTLGAEERGGVLQMAKVVSLDSHGEKRIGIRFGLSLKGTLPNKEETRAESPVQLGMVQCLFFTRVESIVSASVYIPHGAQTLWASIGQLALRITHLRSPG